MTKRREALWVGFATLLALYLFFSPLLPPFRVFHLIGDIEGYHYPLLNYAFKALKQGRFPLWDPTIYCGLSFAGNIQAQLFYPFTWALFAAQWHRNGLQFMALQIFTFAHLWILIQFAYWWLRNGRGLPAAASALGGLTLGLTGYVLNDMQHLGVICGLSWFPMALWGVDRRRIWMITVAGAMTFLAGYPGTWIAMAVTVFFYAAFTAWRSIVVTGLAILLSLALAGIQLLPTAELARLRPQEPVYAVGPPLEWHLFRFVPSTQQQDQYLYYGIAFLAAIPLALYFRSRAVLVPSGLAAIGWIFLQNSGELVSRILAFVQPTLLDVVQHWNFNAVLSVAAALFVGIAWAPVSMLFPRAVWLLVPILLAEQYWFGARRDYFRQLGHHDGRFVGDRRTGGNEFRGLNAEAYAELLAHPEYRIVFDDSLHGTQIRHYGLTTPNGFDPFLSTQLRKEVERYTQFETNRLFRIDVNNEAMLQAFAVGYVVVSKQSPDYNLLIHSQVFDKIAESKSHFQLFVYRNRKPAARFSGGTVNIQRWLPELREFQVEAKQPGVFDLIEQRMPGWRVSIDGVDTPIENIRGAFLAVRIANIGTHTVRFHYQPQTLVYGAILSTLTGIVLLVLRRMSSLIGYIDHRGV